MNKNGDFRSYVSLQHGIIQIKLINDINNNVIKCF